MNIIKKLLSKVEARKTTARYSETDGTSDAVRLSESTPSEEDKGDLSELIKEATDAVVTAEDGPPGTEVDIESKSDMLKSEEEPIDAEVELKVSADHMHVTILLHEPKYGGEHLQLEDVLSALDSEGIIYGIDNELIENKVKNREYGKMFVGATGLPAKDGVDGRVIEVMPRFKTLSFTENERGDVDFKNLNLINQVEKGTVICEIVPPEDPVDGIDVYGKKIEGRPGKTATVPTGENTSLTEDGRQLIASREGNLVYSSGRFSVRERLEISDNVDASTGNIDFSGDVIIKGSVLEGYTIRAGGNVIVYGVVEGARIFADGDVQLMQGINGMGKGIIESKKNIQCRYLEYCTIKADGSIKAEYILHSNVYSGSSITVTGSRSSIIGGITSAFQTIEVKTIGSKTNTLTEIIMGATKEMIEERNNLSEEIRKLERTINNFALDLRFIERCVKEGTATEKHREILLKIQREYPKMRDRLDECKTRYDELEEIISNSTNSRLTCQHIFPPTRIRIGSESIVVQEERFRCDVYYNDGEINFAYR